VKAFRVGDVQRLMLTKLAKQGQSYVVGSSRRPGVPIFHRLVATTANGFAFIHDEDPFTIRQGRGVRGSRRPTLTILRP